LYIWFNYFFAIKNLSVENTKYLLFFYSWIYLYYFISFIFSMDDLNKKNISEDEKHLPLASLWSTTANQLLDEFSHAKELFHEENITDDLIASLPDKQFYLHDKKLEKLVKYIMIEFWQNITKHWLQKIDKSASLQSPISQMSLRIWSNELFIETENYLKVNNVILNKSFIGDEGNIQSFTDHIKIIWNLWYENLKSEHQKVLLMEDKQDKYALSKEEKRQKWAGLWFIDVAKKIKKTYNKIWQVFLPMVEKVNDNIYRFRLITRISLLEQ